jgi:SAM-dependent methyltransferase
VDLYAHSARYYDLIYGAIVDYEREADFLEEVWRRYAGRPIKTVLDLGCGTGNHALLFAARGYVVLGIDHSGAFVALARGKAGEENPRFEVRDMRDLEALDRFDALVCMSGAFAHLPRADARTALRGFRDRLEPGGILTYEWWNERGARDGHQDWLDREGEGIRLIRLGQGNVNAGDHRLRITLKHIILRDDRLEETFTEEDTMALYGAAEMEALLSEAGLHPLAMLDWSRKALEPHRPDDFRVLAVAQRDG